MPVKRLPLLQTSRTPFIVHDSLSTRLASILFKLNQGEKLHPQQLADEFSVDVRTIQRDLNVRLAELPILKENQQYQLDPSYLGRINANSLKSFAMLSGIEGLFPRLDHQFIKQLSQQLKEPSLAVKGQHYEGFDTALVQRFDIIEKAIREHWIVNFQYQKRDGIEKHYTDVHPYRLTNHDGIWYLAALDGQHLKSFAISRIGLISLSQTRFIFKPNIVAQLDEDDSIWLGEKQPVTLQVTGKAMQYFKRRALLPKQQLVSETDDCLTFTTQIRHADQLLPIVQYWIPYVRIIEPIALQEALVSQLQGYLTN